MHFCTHSKDWILDFCTSLLLLACIASWVYVRIYVVLLASIGFWYLCGTPSICWVFVLLWYSYHVLSDLYFCGTPSMCLGFVLLWYS